MKASNVGAMRERVAIHGQTQAIDAAGQIATTWALKTSGDTWARVRPLSAGEKFLAGRDQGVRGYMMFVRYRTDIDTNSRIVWRGRVFDVLGVLDRTEQRQFLEVELNERNA